MRDITVRVMLTVLALVAALHLSTQRAGVAEVEQFDIEEAVTEAKTSADHEAIASYYDKEVATAKAKAEKHRQLADLYRDLAGKVQIAMGAHYWGLAQRYESVVVATAALAAVHRQMAREATQQK